MVTPLSSGLSSGPVLSLPFRTSLHHTWHMWRICRSCRIHADTPGSALGLPASSSIPLGAHFEMSKCSIYPGPLAVCQTQTVCLFDCFWHLICSICSAIFSLIAIRSSSSMVSGWQKDVKWEVLRFRCLVMSPNWDKNYILWFSAHERKYLFVKVVLKWLPLTLLFASITQFQKNGSYWHSSHWHKIFWLVQTKAYQHISISLRLWVITSSSILVEHLS